MTAIRTTHTGSLPRPPQILQAVREHFATGKAMDEALLARTVGDVVRRQVEAGIDIVTDGEMSKPSFFAYLSERMDGFEARQPKQDVGRLGPVDPEGRDAGLYLQIDDTRMVSAWDSRKDMDLAQYRSWMQGRIAHINHALRGLPVERIRYHTCYGVNFGPRVSDLQLDDVLDLLFTINAGFYSFEAANPRHDHEWRVLASIKLPAGNEGIPGAVAHSHGTTEQPPGGAG